MQRMGGISRNFCSCILSSTRLILLSENGCVSNKDSLKTLCHIIIVRTTMSEPDFDKQKQRHLDHLAKNRPFGYYEVLELSHKAKVGEIKKSYFRKAKLYHPDAFPEKNDAEGKFRAEIARMKFDEITEAYQTLMDIDQRGFYDRHGYPSEGLKQKEMPDIFNYVPKFGLYEEEILADNETTAVEDWMAAQGHSTREQNISFKQRLKNAYIEFKWGMAYYNFPWNWKGTFKIIGCFIVFLAAGRLMLARYINYIIEKLPANSPHRPKLFNDLWKDDDPRDILTYIGIRKKYPSEQSRAGLYWKEEATVKKQRNPDLTFTEELANTWRDSSSFSKNKARHDWLKFELRLHKVEMLLKREAYVNRQLAMAIAVQSFRQSTEDATPIEKGNDYAKLSDWELAHRISDLQKQLEQVLKDLESVRTTGEDESKPTLPAKFS